MASVVHVSKTIKKIHKGVEQSSNFTSARYVAYSKLSPHHKLTKAPLDILLGTKLNLKIPT